ncbi:hypothetical protein BD309DRAFT_969932 [Dichomitus squalens]|nr:hypothetical protein BD309DRAFT_969932 [Dichomitus squalens]
MASFKRARSPQNTDLSPSPSPTNSPTPKLARASATPPLAGQPSTSTSAASHSGILCTLPPTCNPPNRPTALAGTHELESHYAMYHAHVCEQKGCGCVFPDAWLLELHQTECHDPLAAVRQERGEKIFACHLATCTRKFSTPKTRRLHLIQAHGYPKEYFFAVTNKGVGGLLKKWGEGASLLRKQWKPREDDAIEEGEDEGEEDADADATEAESEAHAEAAGDDDDDEDEILLEKIQIVRPAGHATAAPETHTPGSPKKARRAKGKDKDKRSGAEVAAKPAAGDIDGLASSLDALSLVPTSIQFGRGAKRGALQGGRGRGHARRGSVGRGHDISDTQLDADVAHDDAAMDVDHAQAAPSHSRGQYLPRGGARGVITISRGDAVRGMGRGRGRGPPRGVVLGAGSGRGMGPGRGVSKG